MEKREEDQNKTKRLLKKPNGFQENPTKAKKPDKEKDKDTDTDKDTDKDINKKEKEKKKSFADVFAENDFDEDLEKALKDFIDMRKALKKPMTTRALELLIKNLQKLTNLKVEQIAIINQSIEHGWQTVYPLKTNQTNTKGGINDFKELMEEAQNEQTGNYTSNNTFSW